MRVVLHPNRDAPEGDRLLYGPQVGLCLGGDHHNRYHVLLQPLLPEVHPTPVPLLAFAFTLVFDFTLNLAFCLNRSLDKLKVVVLYVLEILCNRLPRHAMVELLAALPATLRSLLQTPFATPALGPCPGGFDVGHDGLDLHLVLGGLLVALLAPPPHHRVPVLPGHSPVFICGIYTYS